MQAEMLMIQLDRDFCIIPAGTWRLWPGLQYLVCHLQKQTSELAKIKENELNSQKYTKELWSLLPLKLG